MDSEGFDSGRTTTGPAPAPRDATTKQVSQEVLIDSLGVFVSWRRTARARERGAALDSFGAKSEKELRTVDVSQDFCVSGPNRIIWDSRTIRNARSWAEDDHSSLHPHFEKKSEQHTTRERIERPETWPWMLTSPVQ